MAKARVAINGLGRIGRTILRLWSENSNLDFDIVAANNPGKLENYIHLLKYDSVHGVMKSHVEYDGNILSVDGKNIKLYNQIDPAEIDWSNENVDIVIDATGVFRDQESLSKHLRGTVRKVVLCAPGKGVDGTFVMGINHEDYDPSLHHVISNASCTTNCLAPVAKVLHDQFKIKTGFMTTIHSYTGDQRLLDAAHSDIRRARSAAMSMIPTTTGAAKAVGLVIPDLKGKLDGYAVRVPTPNVSLVDLTVEVEESVTTEKVNNALERAAREELKGVLAYTTEKLVSVDYNGLKESSCVDASLTNVIGSSVKVVAWYDNEAGFSSRIIDLVSFIVSKF